MIIGVTMLIVSFLYLLLTGIMYYSKQRINNEENNIYNYLIIAAFFGIVLELTCILTVPYQDNIRAATQGNYSRNNEILYRSLLYKISPV